MAGLLDRLSSGEVLVCDGAMGTMLMERGLHPGECPERWNLDRPEVLSEIAQLYAEAGADIVSTNTFGGSPLKLAQYGLESQTEEINARAVQSARNAVSRSVMVAGSCGPSGRLLKPYGDTAADEMYESFRRQLRAILDEGVDAIIVETMTDLAEAVLAIKAARSIARDFPVMATMTFDDTPRGFYTVMGVTIQQAVKGLQNAGADLVGSNCGNGIDNMVRIAAEFRKHTLGPLLIQSNAGLPQIVDGLTTYAETPEFMAERVDALLELKVNVIGGCCGTNPRHIAAIRRRVDLLATRT
ncbi:MAG: homocysteine S-methyltransferase family protein [candidate division Zixibacteria bacterium]|nr:homocysteine S-methyltransferase family protein [candidate division Zixibacteria bacterium]